MKHFSPSQRRPEIRHPRVRVDVQLSPGLKRLFGVLVIILVTTSVYWPVLHGDWLWDDYIDISQNSITRSSTGLWSIWFAPGTQVDYYPVKATVQWVQWHLWGDDTLGYHVTNLVLHIVGALLVWRLLGKLGLRFAWLGGLIFAIHPALVESVAWIAELKNTLSMPFFLLAACFYLDYDERGRRRDYALALGLFLVAMLTKPTMVMFPVVILLHAWWKRRRIGWSDVKISAPFFLVSLIIGVLTLQMGAWYVEVTHATEPPIPLGGFFVRLARSGVSLAFYLWKAVLPFGLLPIYPHWRVDPPSLIQFLPWPVLAGIFFWFWTQRQGWGRYLLFGLGFFMLMLLPFSGFLPNDYMRFTWVMDHFIYIPVLGVIGLAVAGLEQMDRRLTSPARDAVRMVLAVALAWLAWDSCDYAAKFVNEKTLWGYELAGNPDAWPAHVNYGNALAVEGRYGDAIHEFQETLRLHPGYAEAESNWGTVLFQMGRPTEAIEHFKRAIQFDPTYPESYYNWGIVLAETGHPDQALPKFEEALRWQPDSTSTHNDYGVALAQVGRKSDAAAQFQEAIRLDPGNQQAQGNLKKLEAPPGSPPGK